MCTLATLDPADHAGRVSKHGDDVMPLRSAFIPTVPALESFDDHLDEPFPLMAVTVRPVAGLQAPPAATLSAAPSTGPSPASRPYTLTRTPPSCN
jgi:hypothetical protein